MSYIGKIAKFDDILEKAASLIEMYGLSRGFFHNGADGSLCIHGAIYAAQINSIDQNDLLAENIWYHLTNIYSPRAIDHFKALSYLRPAFETLGINHPNEFHLGKPWYARWNNDLSTTKQDVVSVLRTAAKFAKADVEKLESVP